MTYYGYSLFLRGVLLACSFFAGYKPLVLDPLLDVSFPFGI
jgi:hypothetical protein